MCIRDRFVAVAFHVEPTTDDPVSGGAVVDTAEIVVPLRLVPLRLMPLRLSPLRLSPLRLMPLRLMPLRLSPLVLCTSWLASPTVSSKGSSKDAAQAEPSNEMQRIVLFM